MRSSGLGENELVMRQGLRAQMRWFLPLLESSRKTLMVGMISLVLSTVLLIRASVILGSICAQLSDGMSLTAQFYQLVMTFILLEIGSVLAQFFGRRMLAVGTNDALLKLRESLFEKLANLPMSYFDAQPLGRIITRITNDVDGVEGFFAGSLARMATACVQIILVLGGILAIAPRFGIFVVISALPALGFSWLTRKKLAYWLAENKTRNAHANSKLAEFIQALPVLRVLGLEDWSGDEFNKDARNHFVSSIRVLTWNSVIRPLTVFLSVIPTLVAVLVGGWFLIQGRADLAAIVAVIRLTERFSNPVRVLTQEIQVVQDASASALRVGEMLSETNESEEKSGDGWSRSIEGTIEFRNIFLTYRSGQAVLKDLNIVIPAGQKLGIMGATGAGKSSILNLIPRLYRPTAGQLLIDHVDVSQWRLQSLRSQIGYLAQEPFLFQGSLAANLLGVRAQDHISLRVQLLETLSQVGLLSIVERFKDGLDFQVREGGVNLSSGEKQMIAFLRLLLEDRPILLMDEATSCLDPEWEAAVQRAILALMARRKRTCVFIAHRLETLKSCDRIIKIHGGRIVADGSPEDILSISHTN